MRWRKKGKEDPGQKALRFSEVCGFRRRQRAELRAAHGHPLATNRADGTHRRADGVEKAAAEGGPSMLTPAQVQQIAKNREEALRRRRDRACDRPAEAEGEPGVSGRSSGSSGGPLQSSSSSSASTSAAGSVEIGSGSRIGPGAPSAAAGRASVMSGAGTVSGRSGGSSGGLRQSSSSSSASSSAAASGVEMGAGAGPDLEPDLAQDRKFF